MPGAQVVDPLSSVRALLQQGRADEAAREAERVLEDHPEMSRGWRLLAQARRAAGQPRKAVEAAARLVDLDPASVQGRRLHAQMLENLARQGNLPRPERLQTAREALEQYETVVEDHQPHNASALKQAAVAATLVYDLREEKDPEDLTKALSYLERAGEQTPGDPSIHRLRGRIHAARAGAVEVAEQDPDPEAIARRNEFLESARAAFVKAFSLAPARLQPINDMVNVLSRFGHHQQAAEAILSQIEKPLDAQVKVNLYIVLGNLYEEMDRPVEAERAYAEAVEVDPAALRTYMVLADLKRRRGQLEKAIQWCERAIERQPAYVNAHLRKGELLLASNPPKAAQAVQTYRRLLEIEPEEATFHPRKSGDSLRNARFTAAVNLAGIHARRGEIEQMNAAFDRAVEIAPDSPLGPYYRARALARLGRLEESRKILTDLLERRPGFVAARQALADVHVAHARRVTDPAEKTRLVRLALDGHEEIKNQAGARPDILYLCARDRFLLWRIRGDEASEGLPTAVEELKTALERLPNHVTAAALLGSIHEATGRYEEALGVHKKVLEVEPTNAVVFPRTNLTEVNRGIAKARLQASASAAWISVQHMDRLEEAESYIEQALELAPNNPSVRDTLGWIRFKQQRHEEAREIFVKAAEAQPESPTILYHLGATHAELGDRQAAARYLRRAIEQGKNHPQFTDMEAARNLLETLH